MDFYPLPQGAADLAAAHEASATVLQGAAAVYDAVQAEAAAHAGYVGSLVGAVKNAVGSAAKKTANKALVPFYKAKDAVDDTAAAVGMTFGPVATSAGGATMPAGATGPGYSGTTPGYQPGAVGATYVPTGVSGASGGSGGLQYVGPSLGPPPPLQVVGGPEFTLGPAPTQDEIPVFFGPEGPPPPPPPPPQPPPPECPPPVVQCPAPQIVMPPIQAPQCPPPQVVVMPPIQGGGPPPVLGIPVPGQPPPIVIPPIQVTQSVTIPPGPPPLAPPPVNVTINLPPEPQQPTPCPVLVSRDSTVTYNQVSYAPVQWIDSHNQTSTAYVAVYAPTSSVVSDESSVYQNTELSLTSQQSTILQSLTNTVQTLSQQWSQQVSTSQQISSVVSSVSSETTNITLAEALSRFADCCKPTGIDTFPPPPPPPPPGDRTIRVDPFEAERSEALDCKPFLHSIAPIPGAHDFCEKMLEFVALLEGIAKALLEPVLGPFDVDDDDNSILAWVKRGVNWLIEDGVAVAQNVLRAWYGIWRGALKNCNDCALFGLYVLDWILSRVSHVVVGAKIIAKLEFTFSINWTRWRNFFEIAEAYLCPNKIPQLGDVIAALFNGADWTADRLRCELAQRGADLDVWRPFLVAQSHHLATDQRIKWMRLNGAKEGDIGAELTRWGWLDGEDLKKHINLYDRPPTPGECFSWASNAVTAPGFVSDYGLDAEFETRLWAPYRYPLRAQGITEEVARSEWAHRQRLPGAGEMAVAVHRLRPGHVDPSLVFTTDDFVRHLEAQGVPQYWRGRLQELVYRPLTRREVSHFVQYRIGTHDVLVDLVKDWGQDPTWAETILRPMEMQGITARLHATGALSLPEMGHMGALGMLSAQQLVAQYAEQGYQQQDAARATEAYDLRLLATGYTAMAHRAAIEPMSGVLDGLRVGVVDRATALTQLTAMGLRPAYAAAIVNAEAWKGYLERVKRVELSVHAAYRVGMLDAPTAVARMQSAGFTAEYMANVMPLWELDKLMVGRQLTEGQIVRLFRDGIIPLNQALGRLTNLGWRTQDAQYLLADEAQKKALADAKKSKVKAVKPKPQKKIGKADVHTLFKHGLLTEQQSRNILAFYGYPEPIVNLFIADWCGPGAGKEGPPEGCAQQNPTVE